MPTPYWGQLPGPKIVENRRLDDEGPWGSSDAPPSHGPKANRTSVQTAITEATDTTLEPYYTTPTNSNIGVKGLAPRPPSYQRPPAATGEPNQGPAVRSSRRQDRDPTNLEDDPIPPVASEASRLAPESRRRPPGGDYPPAPIDKTRQPRVAPSADLRMDHGDIYSAKHEAPYRGHGDAYAGTGYLPADTSRRLSESTSGRRKMSSITKSPLQRLELTLDSMTKEEKRARIQAAERRARERASRKASEPTESQPPETMDYPNHARYVEPQPPAIPAETTLQGGPPPVETSAYSSEMHPGPAPTARHENGRHQSYEPPPSYDKKPLYTEPPPMQKSGIPARSLSFRERAARDELDFESDTGRVEVPPKEPANGGAGFSLTRSGSNKLKKGPPGDPWYYPRTEAEQRIHSVTRREDAPVDAYNPGQLPSQQPPSATDKELAAPEPTDLRRPSADVDSRGYLHSGEEIQGIQRRATEPVHRVQQNRYAQYYPASPQATHSKPLPVERRNTLPLNDPVQVHPREDSYPSGGFLKNGQGQSQAVSRPDPGMYRPPQWLNEWERAPVAVLSGSMLDKNSMRRSPVHDKSKPWWEGGTRRSSYSYSARPRGESFDTEYADLNGPTRFKPPLYLECGPLLRYCGIRQEQVPARSRRDAVKYRDVWRGSIMIVTRDSESTDGIAPMLRLFVQDMEPLPRPPHDIRGDLSPEYVDPIAGHPKLGRRGETLFLRPVDHLEEGKDLSQDETDTGLFESTRTAVDGAATDGTVEHSGTYASRLKRSEIDGEKLKTYADVTGFRLHSEHGCTFWRFNVEVELREKQQRIAYRINRGPCNAFWVPAAGEAMHIMFHSCNGFSVGADPGNLSGPDPMWRDVLNAHQMSPFHVMVGGGDQIYNDEVADECSLFIDWLDIGDPLQKRNAPFTTGLQDQVESFYLQRYCKWFSTGLFGLANSQIPMVNMWSDRESFNGFGSFPDEDMRSHVLSGVGAVAFKYYMLFQHQSIPPETEDKEPSWVLGYEPGPYVKELSRNIFVSLGSKVALLAADCRAERTENDVISHRTWERLMDRVYHEVRRGQVEHLLVLFPVPLAYPRVAWLESLLTSRAMNPVKALGKRGLLGKALSNLENGSEMMDDLRDHWTAKTHLDERRTVVEDLQDLAIDKSLRITILSGDVNMAAVGQFYSNPKLGLAKHKDPRYMPNVISSAIANMPPPEILADALNRRHKTYNFDKQTDESMIPMFHHGVDGKPRNNKRLLPHRNWCAIRQWVPGDTPPPTPPLPDESPSPPPDGSGSGILRRLSLGSSRPDVSKESVRGSRPPVSGGGGGGGLLRSLSRGLSRRDASGEARPGVLTRTLSLGRGDAGRDHGGRGDGEKRGLFGIGRRGSHGRPDDGGINGQWGAESEEDEYYDPRTASARAPRVGLRGGAANDEYSDGDESNFVARPPQRSRTLGATPMDRAMDRGMQDAEFRPKPFHRTPTGLSTKQMRRAGNYEVDLEGGLDICLNVEVNPRDPTGITVPYRLLVPKLHYEYTPGMDEIPEPQPTGLKRFLSLGRKRGAAPGERDRDERDRDDAERSEAESEEYQEDGYQRQRY